MLTAFQCEVVAFVTDGGIICRDCAIEDLDKGDVSEDYRPLIRYSLDEEQTYAAEGWLDWDFADAKREDEDGNTQALIHGRWHVEACGCAPAVWCDRCGEELVEEYVDYTCRDEGDEVPNPPVPRWVPCGDCGARDGEPHRDGCRHLARS